MHVQLGLALNYYRFASELGLIPELSLQQAIERGLLDLFGLNLLDANTWLNTLLQTKSLVEIGKVMPYSLP